MRNVPISFSIQINESSGGVAAGVLRSGCLFTSLSLVPSLLPCSLDTECALAPSGPPNIRPIRGSGTCTSTTYSQTNAATGQDFGPVKRQGKQSFMADVTRIYHLHQVQASTHLRGS